MSRSRRTQEPGDLVDSGEVVIAEPEPEAALPSVVATIDPENPKRINLSVKVKLAGSPVAPGRLLVNPARRGMITTRAGVRGPGEAIEPGDIPEANVEALLAKGTLVRQ